MVSSEKSGPEGCPELAPHSPSPTSTLLSCKGAQPSTEPEVSPRAGCSSWCLPQLEEPVRDLEQVYSSSRPWNALTHLTLPPSRPALYSGLCPTPPSHQHPALVTHGNYPDTEIERGS